METAINQSNLLTMTIWKEEKIFPRDKETFRVFWNLRKGPEHTTVQMYLNMKRKYLDKTLGNELSTKVIEWISSLGIENIEGYPLFEGVC